MAAENDIFIKITSESDLDARQKEIARLTKEAEDFEKELSQLATRRDQDAESIKKQVLQSDALKKKLAENKQYYRQEAKSLKDAIKERKQSIKALSDEVKAYKTLQGQSGKAVQQLRAMREELMRMEDAGQYGTQAFVDLSIKAAELEDQMGDLQQRIRVLASDTKGMDAVLGLQDGLAGAFYVATSGAELFGGEMEGLQQAFYKVQAAMSIVSGVQQVYNALNKDSAAMVVLNTAVTKLLSNEKKKSAVTTSADAAASGADAAAKGLQATATTGAAAAQRSLNAAFMANPIGVVIAGVAALAAGVIALISLFGKAGKAAREARKAMKEYANQSEVTGRRLESLAITHEQAMHAIEKGEETAMLAAKKRHASDLEMSKTELDNLKKRRDEIVDYTNKAINANNIEKRSADSVVNALKDKLAAQRKGSKNYYKVLEELSDAEQKRNDIVRKGLEFENEREEARRAVVQKELDISEQERQIQKQTNDERIAMMRDGMAKEIAQINSDYDEQLRTITGRSKEERALRKALKDKQAQEIADVERRYAIEAQKTLTEIDVQAMEERTKKLNGSEGIEKQLQVWNDYYAARKYQIEELRNIELEEVERSSDDEETKKNRRIKINAEAQAQITALEKDGAEKRLEISAQEIAALELKADKAAHALDQSDGNGPGARLAALKKNLDAELALYDAQDKQLDAQWAAGVISWQDYERQKWEITKAAADARTQYEKDKMQEIADTTTHVLNTMLQFSDLAFEAIGNNIQAQIDKLDEMYTTDWQEAQKDANKKYLTERDYEKRKAELEMKHAKFAKAQAIINAGIAAALAIIQSLAQSPVAYGPLPNPAGIASLALATAMGAAQIAVIAAKPLAQYAKGRKGGKGEYALVGEKGPELMYVPRGASIVPNDKMANPAAWSDYGVPRLNIPELPSVNADTARFVTTTTDGRLTIDYDKLGEAVARNIPRQNAVTVNVDRNGVHVLDGANTHTYLNAKYNGSWS